MNLKQEAVALWRTGKHDTLDIAYLLDADEADVYTAIAHRSRKPVTEVLYDQYYPNRFVRKGVRV